MKEKGVGEQLYSGTAEFGKISAGIGAGVISVISLFIIILGIIVISEHHDKRYEVSGTITSIDGDPRGHCYRTSDDHYHCRITTKYIAKDGREYVHIFSYSGSDYIETGDTISMYIKENEPTNVQLNPPVTKMSGVYVIIFGLALAAIGWGIYYITRKSKFAAAVVGADTAFNIIRH